MKIFHLFLLSFLISPACIFAQDKNRLEETDDRLKTEGWRLEMPLQRQEMEDRRWKMEVEATNQVTGDRLQVVGNNQETNCRVKNRLEEEKNQAADYRLQEVEEGVMNEGEYSDLNNQSSLLANNSVPISNLPSSISYLGITPKLMMDPEELKNGTQAIEEILGLFGKEAVAAEKAVITGEGAGRSDMERAAAFSNSSHQVLRLRGGGPKKFQPRGGLKATGDTSDEEEAENITLAEDYRELASILQRVADQYEEIAAYEIQAVNSWFSENDADYDRFDKTGNTAKYSAYRLEEASAAQKKAIEAKEVNQLELATLWFKIAKQYKESAEYKRQAAKARANRNDIDFNHLDKAGDSARVSARVLEQQADELEALTVQNIMEKEATTSSSKKAAEAMRKFQEARSKAKTMYGSYADAWRSTANSLEKTSKYWTKADEAEGAGKTTLAAGYKGAAEIAQRSADKYQAIAAGVVRGVMEVMSTVEIFGGEGLSLQKQADYQVQAIEAEEAGKTQRAASYREAAATCQRAADQWEQGVQAVTSGKEREGISWAEAGFSFVRQSEYQKKAAQAQDAGKEAFAAGYREVTKISQRAAEYHQQAAEAFALEKEDEGAGWTNVGRFLQSKAREQIKAAEKAEKEESEKSVIKVTHDKRITSDLLFNSKRMDTCKHSINPVIECASTNYQSSSNSACSSSSSLPSSSAAAVPLTSHLPPPTIIRPVGRIIMALSICCEKWLTETKLTEGPVKILSDYIIDVVRRGADHELVKDFEKYWSYVAKNHELGDDPQALAWIQVAEDIQQAIEYSIKKAETTNNQNRKLSNAWNNTVQAMQKVAQYREQYIQAVEQTPEIVSVLKKIVERSEPIADYYRKASEACSLGKIQEYNRCNSAANSMKKKLEEAVAALEKKESST